MDARNVPGNNMGPSSVRVFIDMLSRLLASAKRFCRTAISRLSLDSRWLIKPSSFGANLGRLA